jgi:hypothetical protein
MNCPTIKRTGKKLKRPYLNDEQYGGDPPYNWSSPAIDRADYACMLPPYSSSSVPPCQNKQMNFSSFGEKNLVYLPGINGGFTENYAKWNLTKEYDEADILLLSSNRGATYRIFDNPYHSDLLQTKYGLSRQTLFPCVFDLIFKLNAEVCVGGCQDTVSRLISAGREPKQIRIAMHVRLPGIRA